MRFLRPFFALGAILILAALALAWWAHRPLAWSGAPVEYTIAPGTSAPAIARAVGATGAPISPILFYLLARASGTAAHLQAGTYVLIPGTTPWQVLRKMEHGDVVQIELVIPEGWTFHQMRAAIAADPDLTHIVNTLSDSELMQAIGAPESSPEGLFCPNTYRFARGTTDLQIYQRAYRMLQKELALAWKNRAPDLPLASPYEALTLASIVEKETGQPADRPQVAAVFMNRLKRGMMLQTDPSVIYGMGDKFDGNLHKRDLLTDTPYNTYTHTGLPPTPIALPGAAALAATLNPPATDALYFVARGDGTSQFSENLASHNRAVARYQRGARP